MAKEATLAKPSSGGHMKRAVSRSVGKEEVGTVLQGRLDTAFPISISKDPPQLLSHTEQTPFPSRPELTVEA